MTLHEAIQQVLVATKEPMRAARIAEIINSKGWYTKKDGSEIKSSQIGARVKNYPHLFLKINGEISLKSRTGIVAIKRPLPTRRKNTIKSLSQNPGLEIKVLMNENNFRATNSIKELLPSQPGLYCIRAKEIASLGGVFSAELRERGHNIVYIGIASKSIKKRLGQELWAKGHGTFFRSLGAVLGFRPEKGSLVGKANQNNYKFSASDEAKIISWIEKNLLVNWVETIDYLNVIEGDLIRAHLPLLNIAGHPRAMPELRMLRDKCKKMAQGI